MAHVVFAWELGGGFGHVGPFRPIAQELLSCGHQVTVIVKNLASAATAFVDLNVLLLQAPVKIERARPYDPAPATFGHLLQNMGYRHTDELRAMVASWTNLLNLLRPDCLLFDHCPTGMLAARGLEVPKFTIGTGFFCPVDEFPLREMAPWRKLDPESRARDELTLVDRINSILKTNGQPEIERIGQIYSSVTENLLTTFQELDHYPYREGGSYLGAWSANSARGTVGSIEWPAGQGSKVYAYLKPSKAVRPLVQWLSGQGFPTLLVGDGIDAKAITDVAGRTITIADRHLDLSSVREECDLAIMNGNHGTCCEFLLAGVPVLHLPLTFEQAVFSRRTVELGVALDAAPDQSRQVIAQLLALSESTRCREKAKEFALKYASFEPKAAINRCVGSILDQVR